MSLAPSLAVPRSRFNTLPLAIGLFCLLWSYAFVAGKIGVTHCPPLILLAARFSLAGPGEAAGIDHRDEAAQELQVEHRRLHSKIHWLEVNHLISK